MEKRLILFASEDVGTLIADSVKKYHQDILLTEVRSFQECYKKVKEEWGCYIILQLQVEYDLSGCLRLMRNVDSMEYMPKMLIFEKQPDGKIVYTTTDVSICPEVKDLEVLFRRAIADRYTYKFSYFHPVTAHIDDDDEAFCSQKKNALEEILRGCTRKDLMEYKRKYRLDLRGKGYYVYFWELQNAEYNYHYCNKDVFSFMGQILEKKYKSIIDRFEGGEIIRINLNTICLIINDITVKSEAEKRKRYKEMVAALHACGESETASQYISERIDALENIRVARDIYEKEKYVIFFRKYEGVIRERDIVNKKRADDDLLNKVMNYVTKIHNYIRYDSSNPELMENVKELFFDILKPSMNFTLYYFCVISICSYLEKEDKEMDLDILTENLSRNELRFSSIEEQYDILSGFIRKYQKNASLRNRTQDRIVSRALSYISAHYQEDIAIPEISEALHVSHVYLSQTFRKVMGTSVINYLVTYRIERAKELLADTELPIYSVGEKVGFTDVKHFSKTFKKIVGVPPTVYRKQ